MQNIVIGPMFSLRAAMRVNEIMTTASFESFELKDSINKRPYYLNLLLLTKELVPENTAFHLLCV